MLLFRLALSEIPFFLTAALFKNHKVVMNGELIFGKKSQVSGSRQTIYTSSSELVEAQIQYPKKEEIELYQLLNLGSYSSMRVDCTYW